MPHVLHLYNVFGAATERAWLDYPLALAERGWELTLGYETRAEAAPAVDLPMTELRRIHVEPTEDAAAQMDALAEDVRDPAMAGLLERGVDLVHGHFGPRVLQGAAWLKRGAPTVISLYGYDVGRLLGDASWAGRYRWAAEHGAVFAVLCEAMRDRLIEEGVPGDRVRVIRLGIDVERWRYDPRPGPNPPRFVFVGRLTAKKAPCVLLRAMAELRDRHGVEASLDVIGEGPLAGEVRRAVDELGLSSRVHLHGAVPRDRISRRLAGATGLVLPSVVAPDGDCEGTPVVLMESQAVGLPCITTYHAGNPEVLPPGSPFVVPEHDAAALADAMHRMIGLSDADRRAAQDAGRAWIEQRYDLHQTADQYDALYREWTASGKGSRG